MSSDQKNVGESPALEEEKKVSDASASNDHQGEKKDLPLSEAVKGFEDLMDKGQKFYDAYGLTGDDDDETKFEHVKTEAMGKDLPLLQAALEEARKMRTTLDDALADLDDCINSMDASIDCIKEELNYRERYGKDQDANGSSGSSSADKDGTSDEEEEAGKSPSSKKSPLLKRSISKGESDGKSNKKAKAASKKVPAAKEAPKKQGGKK